MIDLSEVSGLPVKFDEEKGKFYFNDDVICAQEKHVTLSEIVPILLNKYLKYPEIVYKQSKSIATKGITLPSNITYDLMYVPYGLLGIEYMKTHVYFGDYAESKYDCIVEVLHGDLTLVMQKNREREDDYQYDTYVDELSIVNLRRGQKIAIPTGVFYTFVNTGNCPLILSKVSSNNQKEIDYSMLRREKGLACYIISKNAKIETVANPKYKVSGRLKPTSYKQFVEKKIGDNIIYTELANGSDPLFAMVDKLTEVLNVAF